jgi:plasmid stability protein
MQSLWYKKGENGSRAVAVLTIRNIEDGVKERLRVRAAMHGHSMEEEARMILKRAVGGIDGASLWALSRQLFADGVELELPRRDGDRRAPDFDDVGVR